MRYLSAVLAVALCFGMCVGCTQEKTVYGPDNGIWYCDDLDMLVSCERNYQSYMVRNGEKVVCEARIGSGFGHLAVRAQHIGHPIYKLGEEVFYGKILSLDHSKLIVGDDNSGKKYVFSRVELPSAPYCINSAYVNHFSEGSSVLLPSLYDADTYYERVLGSESSNHDIYSSVNELISQEVQNNLSAVCGNNVAVELGFFVTYSSNDLICLMFEGNTNAAENTAFCLNISIENAGIVDPTDYFTIDSAFVEAFLTQLKTQPPNCRFTDEEWEVILAEMEEFTQEEILETFRLDPTHMMVLENNAVTVLFPINHATVDYIKVTVPYIWVKTGNG